jgi:hypothetical protein
MSELFLAVLNMSLTASYVILFVMIVRLLLKKASRDHRNRLVRSAKLILQTFLHFL